MDTMSKLVAGAVAVALVAAVTLLAWQHIIDGQAAVAFLGVVAAAMIGAGAHASGTILGTVAAQSSTNLPAAPPGSTVTVTSSPANGAAAAPVAPVVPPPA